MRAWVVGVVVAGTMLGAAAPAGAAQIGVTGADDGPVPPDTDRSAFFVAAPGERNDITVRASDANGAGTPPLTVTVTDAGATFSGTPSAGDTPCEIVDPHTARCRAEPGNHFTQVIFQTGDGDDSLRFAPDSVPLREELIAGDGDDQFSTGVFLGDASYRWASDMGYGNDVVHIGKSIASGYGQGLGLYAGPGDDTVYGRNGVRDVVECGLGQDTFYADPWDEEQLYSTPSEPCEKRWLPYVGVPAT